MNDILESIGDSEFLTTSQIVEVIKLAADIVRGPEPGKAADLLEALRERIEIDDVLWQRGNDAGGAHALH